jgi:hypothetical protein
MDWNIFVVSLIISSRTAGIIFFIIKRILELKIKEKYEEKYLNEIIIKVDSK